jgi:hypothetical protein
MHAYCRIDADQAEYGLEHGDDNDAAADAEQSGEHAREASRREHGGREQNPVLHALLLRSETEARRVETQVFFDKRRAVVVTGMASYFELQSAFLASGLESIGLQLLDEERVI